MPKKTVTKPKDEIPLIKPKKEVKNPLVFDQVQKSMLDQFSQKNQSGTLNSQLTRLDWLTPDFLDRLEKSPALSKAFTDPMFQKAAAEMASNPQAAIAKYSRERPDLILALKEFAGFLGDHLSTVPGAPESNGHVIPEDLPDNEKELLKRVFANKDAQVRAFLLFLLLIQRMHSKILKFSNYSCKLKKIPTV